MEISFYGRFGVGSLLFQEALPQNTTITVSLWQSITSGERKPSKFTKVRYSNILRLVYIIPEVYLYVSS